MRIVAVSPNWIGDAVMATPSLAALRAVAGVESLTIVCRPYVAAVFDAAPYVDEIIAWDGAGGLGLRAAARKLRAGRYDAAILLTNSFRSALLVYLAGIPERIGYDRDWRGLLLTRRLKAERRDGRYVPSPMLGYYHELTRPLGVGEMPRRMQMFTRAEDDAAAAAVYAALHLEPAETLILAPGAAFGASKCWPASRFAEVARRARDELGLRSLLLCSGKERPVAEQIAAESAGAAMLPQGGMGLGAVKAVVRQARAMVTNDSGLRHFAAAFELPVVTIFGPTHIAWTETWFEREVKLQAAVDCGPCQKKICPRGDLKCMEMVTVDEVLAGLKKVL